MKRLPAVLASLATVVLMLGLALDPAYYTEAVYEGLLVWATKVVPAMLPYFILTKLLSGFGCVGGAARVLSPLTGRLYRVPGVGGYAYLMSIVSGYPVGARVTLDLANAGALDSGQATRVSTFTSTSGPLFVLGTVASLFGSYRIGAVILVCHLVAAALNGLIYRSYGKNRPDPVPTELRPDKTDAVYSSVLSVLTVGGYIAIFFVLAAFLTKTGLLFPLEWLFGKLSVACGLPQEFGSGIAVGLLEITKGCCVLAEYAAAHPLAVTTAACGLISFGGACIQLQGWTYLREAGVNGKIFALSKVTQALIATLLSYAVGSLVIT